MAPRLVALAVADEPAAWQDAGFAVDDGGRCWLGDVAVALTPGTGKGVRAWAVEGIGGPVDGLPAIDLPPAEPAAAANAAKVARRVARFASMLSLPSPARGGIGRCRSSPARAAAFSRRPVPR